MSTQRCPVEDCEAMYAAAVLEKTENHCPVCETPVVECPICSSIVELGLVWDWNECPECLTHRLDLGDAVRESADETEVTQA